MSFDHSKRVDQQPARPLQSAIVLKRTMDLALSTCALIVLAPLWAAVAIVIRLESPGPVIFRQKRVGRHFRTFELLKFRTMVEGAENSARKLTLADDPRVTRSGRFFRKYKLDELPQLVNVLLGDMSLVGPRPEVPEYVELFRADYEGLLQWRPGITDYASIEFRDESEQLGDAEDPELAYVTRILPRKIFLAKRYLREFSLALDLKLIFLSVLAVFSPRKG